MRSIVSTASTAATKVLLQGLLLGSPLLLTAQPQPEPQRRDHGYQVLQESAALYEEGRIDDLLAAYASVHPADSLYELVLVRQASLLVGEERRQEAIPVCEKGIAQRGDREHLFHLFLGSIYMDEDRPDDALAVFEGGLERFPRNVDLHRYRAKTLLQAKRYDEAFAAMQQNAWQYPFDPNVHVDLAALAQDEDQLVPAAMALGFALMLQYNSDDAATWLGYLDEHMNLKVEPDPVGVKLIEDKGYEEIDLLLRNRVAMNKNYKMSPDLPYPYARQTHLMCSELARREPGEGFWDRYYVPVFSRLIDDKLFEGWAYQCLSNSGNKKHQAEAGKKKAVIAQYRDRIADVLLSGFSTFPDTVDGQVREVEHHFNGNGELTAYGDLADGNTVGHWSYFHDNGRLSARGALDENGLKQGEWRHFDRNGLPTRTETWEKGEQTGYYIDFHGNGIRSDSIGTLAGKGAGPFRHYTPIGGPDWAKTFTDGKLTGPAWEYHLCGTVSEEQELVDNQLEGTLTMLLPDGRVKFKGTFKEGLRHGTNVGFHPQGDTSDVYTWVDGKLNGGMREYWRHGPLMREAGYRDGHPVGEMRSYHENGKLRVETPFNDDGKEEGMHREYTSNGELVTELEYARGLLMHYRYLDRSGNVLAEAKRSKGRFELKGYHEDGYLQVDGIYLDEGAKDGTWNYYNPDGSLRLVEVYDKGSITGDQIEYFPDGTVSSTNTFVDGTENGPYRMNHPNGALKLEGFVVDGELDGVRVGRYADGSLRGIEHHAAGLRHGPQYWYDVAGVLERVDECHEGYTWRSSYYDQQGRLYEVVDLRSGEQQVRFIYPDSSTYGDLSYRNGGMHGPSVWHYPDGSLETKGGLLNGERHGPWQAWHPNGKKAYEITYDLGEITGTERYFFDNGRPSSEEEYAHGTLHGRTVRYYPNGKVMIERNYAWGKEHGETRAYSYEGELQLVRYYDMDRLVGYSHPGPDGALVDTIPLGVGVVTLAPKYANGKPSREMTYRNGEIDGTYREYHANGKLLQETTFVNGSIHGSNREYFPDGSPRIEGEYVHGQKTGEHRLYRAPGKLWTVEQYVNGQRHGEAVHHDEQGRPLLILTYRDGDVIAMRKP